MPGLYRRDDLGRTISNDPRKLEHLARQREQILARYFGVPSIKGDNRQLIRQFLLGALSSAIVTPLLFYLRFGTVSWFAAGFTIFLVVLCLLFALGFFFQSRAEYHTRVAFEGNLADRVGSFWLVACAFGPFFGWIITAVGVTESSWRWQYLARAFLAVILPVVTALPLVQYARGKAALIAVPLLLLITALPISSCLWVLADLHDGPQHTRLIVVSADPQGRVRDCREIDGANNDFPCTELSPAKAGESFQVVWLGHTRRVLGRQGIKG